MFPREVILYGDLALAAVMSLIGLCVTWVDKRIAAANGVRKAQGKRTRSRVPEKTIFLLAALGGAPGVWAGMYLFRHKTKHWTFVLGIPAILAAQLALVWFLFFR